MTILPIMTLDGLTLSLGVLYLPLGKLPVLCWLLALSTEFCGDFQAVFVTLPANNPSL